MKTILAILMTVTASVGALAGEHPWKPYAGCYQTLTWNGASVPLVAGEKTEIKEGLAMMEQGMDGKEIPSVLMLIFRKDDAAKDQAEMYDYVPAYLDRGSATMKGNFVEYFYEGELQYKPQPSYTFHLHQEITLRQIDANKIEIVSDRTIKEFDMLNGRNTYVLQKINCK